MLFRMARRSFGRMPAFLSLAVLCFLPSLFAWSISVLKEPLYFLLTVSCIALTLAIVRAGWLKRVGAAAALVMVIAALGTVRQGGAALTGGGIALGLATAWLVLRPRALVVAAIALPIATERREAA